MTVGIPNAPAEPGVAGGHSGQPGELVIAQGDRCVDIALQEGGYWFTGCAESRLRGFEMHTRRGALAVGAHWRAHHESCISSGRRVAAESRLGLVLCLLATNLNEGHQIPLGPQASVFAASHAQRSLCPVV